MRILFGHQSVGQNIIDGLRETAASVGAIVSIDDAERTHLSSDVTLMAHFRVGTNGAPESKIRHFVRTVLSRADQGLDLALFKFCYVDIVNENDVQELFSLYSDTLDRLQATVASTAIGHVTVPLRAPRRGVLSALRRWRSGEDSEDVRNRARHRFNEHIRERYARTGLLFDLAAAESGEPLSATKTTITAGIPALRRDYTTDGGHLNAAGRAAIAAGFVQFLDGVRSRLRNKIRTESVRAEMIDRGM